MQNALGKIFNIFCILVIITVSFIPAFAVEAANAYSVQMVSNSGANQVIGTYATYSEAVKVMNAQKSTSTSVASVYKNGKIINSRYAIFQFKPNTSTLNMYQTIGGSAYTYIRPSSMTRCRFYRFD